MLLSINFATDTFITVLLSLTLSVYILVVNSAVVKLTLGLVLPNTSFSQCT